MADKPNLLLTASAVAYFVASVPAIFAGEELLDLAGAAGTSLGIALGFHSLIAVAFGARLFLPVREN